MSIRLSSVKHSQNNTPRSYLCHKTTDENPHTHSRYNCTILIPICETCKLSTTTIPSIISAFICSVPLLMIRSVIFWSSTSTAYCPRGAAVSYLQWRGSFHPPTDNHKHLFSFSVPRPSSRGTHLFISVNERIQHSIPTVLYTINAFRVDGSRLGKLFAHFPSATHRTVQLSQMRCVYDSHAYLVIRGR